MENDKALPTSLWDGWERQFRGSLYGGPTDSIHYSHPDLPPTAHHCAITWLCHMDETVELIATKDRVTAYIRSHYEVPPDVKGRSALVWANNHLGLTPEQFREIDRLTQIEAAVKPLVDSVPALVQEQEFCPRCGQYVDRCRCPKRERETEEVHALQR